MNTTATMTRTLGRSGIPVSAMGLGCWAIGGPNRPDTGESAARTTWIADQLLQAYYAQSRSA